MAIDSVSCASGPSAPSEMRRHSRLRSSVIDSTLVDGDAARSVLKSKRSRRLMGGRRRTCSLYLRIFHRIRFHRILQHVDEVALEIVRSPPCRIL